MLKQPSNSEVERSFRNGWLWITPTFGSVLFLAGLSSEDWFERGVSVAASFVCAFFAVRLALVRICRSSDAYVVVNVLRVHRVNVADVLGVSCPGLFGMRGFPWVLLELADGSLLRVTALPGDENDRIVRGFLEDFNMVTSGHSAQARGHGRSGPVPGLREEWSGWSRSVRVFSVISMSLVPVWLLLVAAGYKWAIGALAVSFVAGSSVIVVISRRR